MNSKPSQITLKLQFQTKTKRVRELPESFQVLRSLVESQIKEERENNQQLNQSFHRQSTLSSPTGPITTVPQMLITLCCIRPLGSATNILSFRTHKSILWAIRLPITLYSKTKCNSSRLINLKYLNLSRS